MTPLIDVVMCLIVFYLIVGHLVMSRKGEQDLPETRVGEEAPDASDPVVVSVARDGPVLVDSAPTERDRLESVLAGRVARGARRVQVRADRELAYDRVQPVIDACRASGVGSVELVTTRALDGSSR